MEILVAQFWGNVRINYRAFFLILTSSFFLVFLRFFLEEATFWLPGSQKFSSPYLAVGPHPTHPNTYGFLSIEELLYSIKSLTSAHSDRIFIDQDLAKLDNLPTQMSSLDALKGAGWPVRNLFNFATADPNGDGVPRDTAGAFSGGPLRPYHNRVSDYVAVQAGQLPKILLAVAVWHYTVDIDAAAKGWDWSPTGWVATVLLRDLVLMVLIAFGWDYILYFSPLKHRLAPYKLNQEYPTWEQIRRDAFWTTSATLLASAQEVLLYYWWAGNCPPATPLHSAALADHMSYHFAPRHLARSPSQNTSHRQGERARTNERTWRARSAWTTGRRS